MCCSTLSNLTIYNTWKNIKKSCKKKKKIKVSATIWNENFDLSHKLYFVSDIQYYFQHIIKKHVTVTDNPSRKIYANQIENMITFRITTKYYFELLPPETMKIH